MEQGKQSLVYRKQGAKEQMMVYNPEQGENPPATTEALYIFNINKKAEPDIEFTIYNKAQYARNSL